MITEFRLQVLKETTEVVTAFHMTLYSFLKSQGSEPYSFGEETFKTFNCNQASTCVVSSEIFDNSSDGPKHVAD
jgi:hypothetical protein